MTPEEELKALKQLLLQVCNMVPPTNVINLPTGPAELVHGYRVGFANGWVAYRQQLKKTVFPEQHT